MSGVAGHVAGSMNAEPPVEQPTVGSSSQQGPVDKQSPTRIDVGRYQQVRSSLGRKSYLHSVTALRARYSLHSRVNACLLRAPSPRLVSEAPSRAAVVACPADGSAGGGAVWDGGEGPRPARRDGRRHQAAAPRRVRAFRSLGFIGYCVQRVNPVIM